MEDLRLSLQVSIIIPVYFRLKDLSELFDSIIIQSYKPLEVIIVDDTPSNEIKNLCEECKAKFANEGINLIYIRNPRERSAAIARNVGTKISRGDIVLFLDSDIILSSDFIDNIIKVFREKPQALGVQGYMVNIMNKRRKRYDLIRDAFNKVFHAYYRYPRNSCKLFEYPANLTEIIECEWMSGSASAFRREIFDEFRFDEGLKGYSFMEDVLFSHSIFRKYPGRLFITPNAKYEHKFSPKNYEEAILLEEHKKSCRKYVLWRLFGARGILLYYWQNIGILILSLMRKMKLKHS
ncbi:MAG: glycosyltransferase family A protein [Candidatus Bathyarchaeia archaeon]